MKYAKVVYKGSEDRIGRFGTVKHDDEILLTETEYDCVREDDRYKFKEWVDADKRSLKPARTNTESTKDARSEGTPAEPSPPSRVTQDIIDPDGEVEVADEDEVEDGEVEIESYEDLTVKQLKAEIKVRNALLGDDEQIEPESSKKSDLVAALEADDEADNDEE